MMASVRRCLGSVSFTVIPALLLPFLVTGCALFYGSNRSSAPAITVAASPTTIVAGASSTLSVNAINATQVTVTGSDGSSYNLQANGGSQAVSPKTTTT